MNNRQVKQAGQDDGEDKVSKLSGLSGLCIIGLSVFSCFSTIYGLKLVFHQDLHGVATGTAIFIQVVITIFAFRYSGEGKKIALLICIPMVSISIYGSSITFYGRLSSGQRKSETVRVITQDLQTLKREVLEKFAVIGSLEAYYSSASQRARRESSPRRGGCGYTCDQFKNVAQQLSIHLRILKEKRKNFIYYIDLSLGSSSFEEQRRNASKAEGFIPSRHEWLSAKELLIFVGKFESGRWLSRTRLRRYRREARTKAASLEYPPHSLPRWATLKMKRSFHQNAPVLALLWALQRGEVAAWTALACGGLIDLMILLLALFNDDPKRGRRILERIRKKHKESLDLSKIQMEYRLAKQDLCNQEQLLRSEQVYNHHVVMAEQIERRIQAELRLEGVKKEHYDFDLPDSLVTTLFELAYALPQTELQRFLNSSYSSENGAMAWRIKKDSPYQDLVRTLVSAGIFSVSRGVELLSKALPNEESLFVLDGKFMLSFVNQFLNPLLESEFYPEDDPMAELVV